MRQVIALQSMICHWGYEWQNTAAESHTTHTILYDAQRTSKCPFLGADLLLSATAAGLESIWETNWPCLLCVWMDEC